MTPGSIFFLDFLIFFFPFLLNIKNNIFLTGAIARLTSRGVAKGVGAARNLTDQLTLFKPGGTDYEK